MLALAVTPPLRGPEAVQALIATNQCSGCNFYAVDLRFRRLPNAQLAGAFLAQADLSFTDLSNANLQGSSLAGADLTGANLTGADLRGANLSRAILTRAQLTGAQLAGANLREAYLLDAIDPDLRAAQFCEATLPNGQFGPGCQLPPPSGR